MTSKLEQIKNKIYEEMNKKQPHDLESEIDLAVKIVAREIIDDLGFEWGNLKKEWGLK